MKKIKKKAMTHSSLMCSLFLLALIASTAHGQTTLVADEYGCIINFGIKTRGGWNYLTTQIDVGQTVCWNGLLNMGTNWSEPGNVAQTTGQGSTTVKTGGFRSGPVGAVTQFRFTFVQSGDFFYFSEAHPTMQGNIRVLPLTTAPTFSPGTICNATFAADSWTFAMGWIVTGGREGNRRYRPEYNNGTYGLLTVTIVAGQTVCWTGLDQGRYNVNQGRYNVNQSTYTNNGFISGRLGAVATFDFTFMQSGSFFFFCEAHPKDMQGTVTVLPLPPGQTLPPLAPVKTTPAPQQNMCSAFIAKAMSQPSRRMAASCEAWMETRAGFQFLFQVLGCGTTACTCINGTEASFGQCTKQPGCNDGPCRAQYMKCFVETTLTGLSSVSECRSTYVAFDNMNKKEYCMSETCKNLNSGECTDAQLTAFCPFSSAARIGQAVAVLLAAVAIFVL